jgi:archaellum biogenesis ATPase FlaH
MNDVDLDNEIKAIKTMCGTREKPRTLLIQKGLNIEHFDDPRTKELFKCIQAMARSLKEIPTYFALSTYPNLSPDARNLKSGNEDVHKPAKNVGDAELFFNELDRMRKARICSAATKEVQALLNPEDADPDAAAIVYEKALLQLRNIRNDTTIRVGTDSNLMEHVDKSLNRTSPNVIPTGFRDFDEEAGGLPRGGLTTLAASSGGGKSCLGLQVAINGVNIGYNAAVVTLEMNAEQTTNRLMANISSTNHDVFHLAKANSMQKQRSRKMMDEWNEANLAAGRRLQVYHIPDTTMSSIALQLRPFDFDIIVVDYINLLNKEDTDAANEAAQLGEIARQAKIQASQTNAAWIVLAQLNEQGIVKYSRAIKEHSDYMWSWTYGDAERQSHIIEIEQQKSRNSKGFQFCLKERFEYQRFENAGEAHENRDLKGVRKAKTQKKHPTAKPMPGLDFDEDDDDE